MPNGYKVKKDGTIIGPNGSRGQIVGTTEDGRLIIKRENGGHYAVGKDGVQDNSVGSSSQHGNSKDSSNAQHGYHIIDTDTGKRVKPGVSGQPLNADGTSPRAQSQVDKLNADRGREQFTHEVVKNIDSKPKAREEILDWEKAEADKLRNAGEIDPEIHQRP